MRILVECVAGIDVFHDIENASGRLHLSGSVAPVPSIAPCPEKESLGVDILDVVDLLSVKAPDDGVQVVVLRDVDENNGRMSE